MIPCDYCERDASTSCANVVCPGCYDELDPYQSEPWDRDTDTLDTLDTLDPAYRELE